jgi:hypothetical protein
MTTLWNICAWTGLIWWFCAVIGIVGVVLMTFGRDEYGEMFPVEEDSE